MRGIKLSEFILGKDDFTHENKIDEYDLTVDDILKYYCVPPLGAESYFPELFGKYGKTITGIFDKFEFYCDDIPEIDKWKMIALSAMYWEHKCERMYEEAIRGN